MRLDIEAGVVTVALSRRNLKALLAKLDGFPPNSARTITKEEDAGLLVVIAEEDDLRYDERGYPPGEMHPDTEAAP